MKLYFAGLVTAPDIFVRLGIEHVLESYLFFQRKKGGIGDYLKQNDLEDIDLFLDSGAFTAFTQGKEIDIDKYIAFIKRNKDYINVYATLDVIGDFEGTYENTLYMESEGLKPLPVFHFKSPLKELRKMVEKYDYLALGGLVPIAKSRKKLRKWLDTCFSIIKNKAKVHGFGVNALWAWKRYPFYSVDATSWLMGGKFRRMVTFKQGKLKEVSKWGDKSKSLDRLKVIQDNYRKVDEHNVREYQKAADYVTKLWKKRGVEYGN